LLIAVEQHHGRAAPGEIGNDATYQIVLDDERKQRLSAYLHQPKPRWKIGDTLAQLEREDAAWLGHSAQPGDVHQKITRRSGHDWQRVRVERMQALALRVVEANHQWQLCLAIGFQAPDGRHHESCRSIGRVAHRDRPSFQLDLDLPILRDGWIPKQRDAVADARARGRGGHHLGRPRLLSVQRATREFVGLCLPAAGPATAQREQRGELECPQPPGATEVTRPGRLCARDDRARSRPALVAGRRAVEDDALAHPTPRSLATFMGIYVSVCANSTKNMRPR
jgi:hypothetical protein